MKQDRLGDAFRLWVDQTASTCLFPPVHNLVARLHKVTRDNAVLAVIVPASTAPVFYKDTLFRRLNASNVADLQQKLIRPQEMEALKSEHAVVLASATAAHAAHIEGLRVDAEKRDEQISSLSRDNSLLIAQLAEQKDRAARLSSDIGDAKLQLEQARTAMRLDKEGQLQVEEARRKEIAKHNEKTDSTHAAQIVELRREHARQLASIIDRYERGAIPTPRKMILANVTKASPITDCSLVRTATKFIRWLAPFVD